MPRNLRVFLCHAVKDKPAVRTLYAFLKSVPWIEPWLDEENLRPAQDWEFEISKAIIDADVIFICLSAASENSEAYFNGAVRRVLRLTGGMPETIQIVLRLDDCAASFELLQKLQRMDYFVPNAQERLLEFLRSRADGLKISIS